MRLLLPLLACLGSLLGLAPAHANLFEQRYAPGQAIRTDSGPPAQLEFATLPWKAIDQVPLLRYALFQEYLLIGFKAQDGAQIPGIAQSTVNTPDRILFDVATTAAKEMPAKGVALALSGHAIVPEIRATPMPEGMRVVVQSTLALPVQELPMAPEGWRIYWIGTNFEQRAGFDLAPGVTYVKRELFNAAGNRKVHTVRIDPQASGFLPELVTGPDLGRTRGTAARMLDHWGGALAINGGYFDSSGRPVGLLIRDGAILSKPIMDRPSFAISDAGQAAIGFLPVQVTLRGWRGEITTTRINGRYTGDQPVLLSPGHPSRLMAEGGPPEAWKVIIKDDTVMRAGFEPVTIDERQQRFILLVPPGLIERAGFSQGERLEVEYKVGQPDHPIHMAVQAGPMLVLDGKIRISEQGDFPRDIRKGRAPRSGIGLTPEGHIVLVAVDGRQDIAAGATLSELATYLIDAGAKVAMNLDGGSSTQLVVGGDLVTSHPKGVKEVANVLVFVDSHGRVGRQDFYF